MKTLTTIAFVMTATTVAAEIKPNNYVYTNNQTGVMVVIDQDGENFDTTGLDTRIIDLASQAELNAVKTVVDFNQTKVTQIGGTVNGLTNEVRGRDTATNARIDALTQEVVEVNKEDMRVSKGEVVGDEIVLTVRDMAPSRGRSEVYSKEVKIDVSSLKGQKGADGDDGESIKGKDAISGLALISALDSVKGDGIGFGISKEEGSDFTFSTAVKFEIDNRTNFNVGVTITEDGRKAASVGIGFSF